jgi:hypothetical protein
MTAAAEPASTKLSATEPFTAAGEQNLPEVAK